MTSHRDHANLTVRLGEAAMKLRYAIKYVADMGKAVAFYRDVMDLPLRFQSPDWSEFETGETTLALHGASDEHPAGSAGLAFGTDDLDAFHISRAAMGVDFIMPPTQQDWARTARIRDSEGAELTIGG
jgi:lactoylglutathione lyase